MKVDSGIYGSFDVDEPVLLDLMEDRSLQRLKKVDMSGYPKPFWPDKKEHNRYDHSVRTMLLLRKYGASIEEQISGLTHDVTHTALSHGVDYVNEMGGSPIMQNYQDSIFSDYTSRNTEIPIILKRNGFDPKFVLDSLNFPLREMELPGLCADRLDYTFGEAVATRRIDSAQVREYTDHLKAVGKNWAFDHKDYAMKFAKMYKSLNDENWSGVKSAIMFNTIGKVLSCALSRNYIERHDLHTDDETLLNKIRKHTTEDDGLRVLMDRMEGRIECEGVEDSSTSDCMQPIKSRAVDPLIIKGKGLVKLSSIVPEWGRTVTEDLKPKTHYLRFKR